MPRVDSDEDMDKDLMALQRCAVQPEACRRDFKHGCLGEVAGCSGRARVRVLDRLRKRGLALVGKLASWNLYRVSRHPSSQLLWRSQVRPSRARGACGAHTRPG